MATAAGEANRSIWSAACRWFTPTPNNRTLVRGCSSSQLRSSSTATRAMVRESVVLGSKRFWRVNVVKSARRIFTCTQPVARFCARMREPARSARRITSDSMRAASPRSVKKVSSALIDFSSHSDITGRSSMPEARSRMRCESRPKMGQSSESGAVRSCAKVVRPAASTRSPSLRPRPGRRRTLSGSSVARMLEASTTVSPSGLLRSEPILATSLLGATPTEAVSRVSSRIFCLMPRAMLTASPLSARLAVTSRKASSSERPSTTGVYSWKMANTSCDTSR